MDVTMTVVDDARAAALPIHETEARGEVASILTADPGPVRGREIGGGRATPLGGQGRTAGPVPALSRPTLAAKAKAGTGRRTRSLTKVVTSRAASRPSDTVVAAVNRDDMGFVLMILELSAKIIALLALNWTINHEKAVIGFPVVFTEIICPQSHFLNFSTILQFCWHSLLHGFAFLSLKRSRQVGNARLECFVGCRIKVMILSLQMKFFSWFWL